MESLRAGTSFVTWTCGGLRTPSSRGFRHKGRKALRKRGSEVGLKVTRFLRSCAPGEKVVFDIDPSVHKGMPHRRYQGKVGVVLERRGRAYVLETRVGGKTKTVIARPEHIKIMA